MKYTCKFIGQKLGALGITYPCTIVVEADSEEQARLRVYDTHDVSGGDHRVLLIPHDYSVGDYVQAGDTNEDRDVGQIVRIDGNRLFIAWTNGTATDMEAQQVEHATSVDYQRHLHEESEQT